MKINHVLIQTNDLNKMSAFLKQITGLEEGYRPPFPFPGIWIYSDHKPLFHLVELSSNSHQSEHLGTSQTKTGVGTFDHIALEGVNYDELISRLTNCEYKYIERTVPLSKEHQVFVFGPENVKIEFIFNEDKSDLNK